MGGPSTVFVYRNGISDGRFQGRCVCCDAELPENWPQDQRWRGQVLPDGPTVEVAQVFCEVIETVEFLDAARSDRPNAVGLRGDLAFISGADLRCRPRLQSLLSDTYLFLDSKDCLPAPPYFISFEGPTLPGAFEISVALSIDDVVQVPDVQIYLKRHERAPDLFDFERQMYAELDGVRIPLPVGALLPASVSDGFREVVGVYRIREYIESTIVRCDLYVPDCKAIDVQPGNILNRTAIGRLGERFTSEIGRIQAVFSGPKPIEHEVM